MLQQKILLDPFFRVLRTNEPSDRASTGVRHSLVRALLCAALLLGWSVSPVAAQDGETIGQTTLEGRVVSESFFETSSFVYRVVTITPAAGGPERTVLALGGPRSDGTVELVSHQPELPLGAVVRLVDVIDLGEAAASELVTAGFIGPLPVVVRGGAVNETILETSGAGTAAYVLSGWAIKKMPTSYTLSGNGPPDANPQRSVKAGIAVWENDSCSSVEARLAGRAPGSFAMDGRNTISWQPSSEFVDPSLLGLATVAYRDGVVLEWDIGFNKAAKFSASPQTGKFDLPTVAAHEFGHVLGLGHTTAPNDLMAPVIESGTRKGLAKSDRNGLRKLYGSPCESSTKVCHGKTVTVDLTKGEKSTNGDDVIWGTMGADTIYAGPGNDVICGRGGDDKIYGGRGADVINGNRGNDRLEGGTGPDRIFGGPGADILLGRRGRDHLFGGEGADRLDGGSRRDRCFGGPSTDRAFNCESTNSVP